MGTRTEAPGSPLKKGCQSGFFFHIRHLHGKVYDQP